MTDIQLANRIEDCRSNYEVECGKPFKDFFRPILFRDEPAEMCKGHIVNDALSTCNQWVPQRRDVDNFYGHAVEADLVSVVQDRGRDPMDIWLDPKSRGRHRPKLVQGDREIEHYFTGAEAKPVPVQSLGKLVNDQGDTVCKFALKVGGDEIAAMENAKISLVIDRDYRAPVIASMIKAAHLSLFNIFGYRHVFSPTGYYPAAILRQFFEKHSPPGKCMSKDVEKFFRPLQGMVVPLAHIDRNVLKGTVTDRRFFSCFASSGGVFAIGVVINAGENDAFCVFLPGMDRYFDDYIGFLKEPAAEIGVKVTQYCPPDENGGGRMEIPPGEPVRVPLPRQELIGTATGAVE